MKCNFATTLHGQEEVGRKWLAFKRRRSPSAPKASYRPGKTDSVYPWFRLHLHIIIIVRLCFGFSNAQCAQMIDHRLGFAHVERHNQQRVVAAATVPRMSGCLR